MMKTFKKAISLNISLFMLLLLLAGCGSNPVTKGSSAAPHEEKIDLKGYEVKIGCAWGQVQPQKTSPTYKYEVEEVNMTLFKQKRNGRKARLPCLVLSNIVHGT